MHTEELSLTFETTSNFAQSYRKMVKVDYRPFAASISPNPLSLWFKKRDKKATSNLRPPYLKMREVNRIEFAEPQTFDIRFTTIPSKCSYATLSPMHCHKALDVCSAQGVEQMFQWEHELYFLH